MLKSGPTYNAYMKVYMLRRYRERRKEAIKYLGGKCARCEETQRLEFDHIDPRAKIFTIAKLWSLSKAKFWAEVVKCQLLCPKHHNKKTIKEAGKKEAKGKHGTISSYRYCKCPRCRKAKSDYNRARSSVGRAAAFEGALTLKDVR